MEPALVFPVLSDAQLERLQIRQKISVRQNNAAWLSRRPRSVKNFRNGASRGCVARIHASISGRLRACHHILEIVDDHRRWRAEQLHLLTIAQDESHAGILDRALHEIRRRSSVHRHNNRATQKGSPVAGDPLGGIGPPEKHAVTRGHAAPGERAIPEKRVGVKFRIRQFFPTVAAPLDDGHVAAKAGKFRE